MTFENNVPYGFNERALAYAGHSSDADAHRVASMRHDFFKQLRAQDFIFWKMTFDQSDCLSQHDSVAVNYTGNK